MADDDRRRTPRSDAKLAKLRRAKPADLVDACWTRDEHPQKIVEKQLPTSGSCNELYPSNSFPRGVAGSPIANDVIKCQLKPVSASDYKVTFTADEMARLKTDLPGRRVRLVEARRRSAADGGDVAVPPGGAAEHRDAIGEYPRRARVPQ